MCFLPGALKSVLIKLFSRFVQNYGTNEVLKLLSLYLVTLMQIFVQQILIWYVHVQMIKMIILIL